MNVFRLSFLVLLASFLVACGSSAPSKKIDGVWFANLQNSDTTLAYTFSATLTQSTGSTVTVSSFSFTSDAPCFTAPIGQTATFSVTGHAGGFEVGTFGMDVTTAMGTQVENVLALTGARAADGTISGTWTLTGLSGCSGNGTYTMTAPTPL